MDLTGKVDDLIDVSAEDDCLLTSPTTKDSGKFEFSQSPATSVRASKPRASLESIERCGENKEQFVLHKDAGNCQADEQSTITNPAIEGEQPPLCEEDVQPKKKKKAAQFNLRKSLAWDQAFFTNEGVLNPVELSLLSKTFKKSNDAFLPSIEEEESVRSSLDSNSTLSGDILALETLEENLFTEPHTSNGASFGTAPVQSGLPPLPNAKLLATEKRNTITNVPKSPENKASYGAQDSFTFKRSSSNGTENLHKPSQLNEASGKNCASAPTVATKKVPTGHKRMKYTHGNAVPVNGIRATLHRNTPSKAKENSSISGRSATSLNSSTSEHLDSAKRSASSRTVFEIPKCVASGTTDLSNNTILPKISSSQCFDGASDLVSSRVSNDLTISNSESVVTSHNFYEQPIPKIVAGISTDSAFPQYGKQNRGLEKANPVDLPTKSASTTSTCSGMMFNAKVPTNRKQNHGFEKGIAVGLATKSGSTTAARSSMIFTAKDPPSKSGCARPANLQSKPTGLRMPAPKHGFFDTEKVIRPPHPALQKRSNSNRILPPKSMPGVLTGNPQGSRLKPPGVPLPHDHPGYRGTVPSGISMASHLRPESAMTSSIASIPAPPLQSQLKVNLEGSGLALLAHQKFGFSPKAQLSSNDQRSDQRQVSSDACNAAAQSSFSQVNLHNQKGTCHVVLEEDQSQSSFTHQKCKLQDVSQMSSEQKNLNANDIETFPVIDTGKISNMIETSCLQSHYEHGIAVVADATLNSVSKLSHSEHLLQSTHGNTSAEELEFKGTDKEISLNGNTLAVNSSLLNSLDHGIVQKHVDGRKSEVDIKTLTSSPVSSSVFDDIAEKENILLGLEGQDIDSHQCISSRKKSVDDVNVQIHNFKNPDARPFSEEWLRALEQAGEELLQMKSGPVQNSPPDKIVPQPGPWSPVRRYSQQIGPFDCTKYTNAPGTNGDCQDQ